MTPQETVDIRRLIVSNEGWRTSVYRDSLLIPTIGVGFNLQRADAEQRITALGLNFQSVLHGTQSLTDSQVDQLFQQDFNAALQTCEGLFPGFDNLTEGRQAVLMDMALNLGQAGLAGFTNMIAAVNAGNWPQAQAEMRNSVWAGQVGDRAPRDINAMGTGNMPALGRGGTKPLDKSAKEGKEGKEGGKDTSDKGKDGKEGKEGKEGKDSSEKGKDGKEGKEGKDSSDKGKESKDGKDSSEKGKDEKEGKEGKDSSDKGKEGKDGKDSSDKGKEGKDGKDSSDKGKDEKEGKEGKDSSDKGKEGKDGKDSSDKGKDEKDGKEGKDSSDKGKDGKDEKDGKEDKDGKEGLD